jgi:hypothetical protein
MIKGTLGVNANDSSLAANWGLAPSEFIKGIGSAIINAINKGILAAKDLVNRMAQGAAALVESIKKGTFLSLIKSWIKDNPVQATVVAVGLLVIGGIVVGAIGTGVAAIASAIAGAGFATKAAILAVAIPFCVQGAQKIINFDWQKTDNTIEAELRAKLSSLYAVAGEAIGRSLAGLVIGKGKQPPVQINMRATATFFLILEEQGKTEIQEEVLQALAELAWAAARFVGNVVAAKSYMWIRKAIRENVRTGIKSIDDVIASWGTVENRSWSISANVIQKGIEAVQAENEDAGQFLENFVEGFGEGLNEFLIMEYSR